MDRLLGGLEVDPGVSREPQADLGTAGQHVGAEDRAQPREQRAQRGVGPSRCAPWPQRFDQLLATRRKCTVDNQESEEHTCLAAREARRQLVSGELDREPAA
jgi:hypothetical protein